MGSFAGFTTDQMLTYLARQGVVLIGCDSPENLIDQKWHLILRIPGQDEKKYKGPGLFNVAYQAFKPHLKDAEREREEYKFLFENLR